MSTPPKSRVPLYVGAWLATAVVTFYLGRTTATSLLEKHGDANRATDRGTSTVSNASTTQTAAGNDASTEDLIARVFGGHASSLEQVLGGHTLEEHVSRLLKIDDEATRMLGFLRLLEALNTADDIRAVLDTIAKENGGRLRVTEQGMLLQKWAKMDPQAAAAYANSQRDFARFAGMNAVLRTWLQSNPDAAIAWAQANGAPEGDRGSRGGPDDGNWAVATMIGPLAQQNLDRALELAKNQTESRARGRMIDTLVDEILAQRGSDAARNAIADLPDDAFRAGMASRWVDKLMGNSDPKEVAPLAWALPSGETRERAMGEVVRRIADNDPVAAANLLQQYGNSPDLDTAKGRLAWEIVSKDPEGAIVWTQSMTDEKQRAESLQRIIGGIARQNPDLAQQYATQYGIPLQVQRQGGQVRR